MGIGIGVLPGIGGAVSNVVAYSAAKQSSKEPEKFGTGCIDGIIASETSNSAQIGGAMVSQKHGNFIINLGGAKARDVRALMKEVARRVKETSGVELAPEVKMVGE